MDAQSLRPASQSMSKSKRMRHERLTEDNSLKLGAQLVNLLVRKRKQLLFSKLRFFKFLHCTLKNTAISISDMPSPGTTAGTLKPHNTENAKSHLVNSQSPLICVLRPVLHSESIFKHNLLKKETTAKEETTAMTTTKKKMLKSKKSRKRN